MLPEERKEGSPRFGKLHFPVGLWINSPKKRLAKMSRRWPSAGSVRSTSSDTPSRASDPSDPRPISSPAVPPPKAKPPRHKRLSHLFHRATTTSATSATTGATTSATTSHPHSRWASEKKLSDLRDPPGALLGSGVSPSPPCILKIFGGAISRGANYKSVLATPRCSARALVREALERYGLNPEEFPQFALCDVVGRPGGAGGSWQPEHLREVGDAERPLLLQELWKPKPGWSRRFEIRRRQDLDRDRDRDSNGGDGDEGGDGAGPPAPSRRLHRNRSRAASGGPAPPPARDPRGDAPGPGMRRSISDMNLSTRRRMRKALSVAGGGDGAGPAPAGATPTQATPPDGGEGAGGPDLELLSQCLIQPPRDRPYFLLLRGYGKEDFVLFIMTRPQHIFGRLDRRGPGVPNNPPNPTPDPPPGTPEEPPPQKPDPGPFSVVDTFLDAPDLLPRHCLVQADPGPGLGAPGAVRDPLPNNNSGDPLPPFSATVRPFRGAPTTLNGTPLFRRAPLRPGDLLGLGEHVLLLYKDPRAGEGSRPPWAPPPRPPMGILGVLGCAGCGRSPRERREELRAALRSPRAELRYRPQDEGALLRDILGMDLGGFGGRARGGPGQGLGGPAEGLGGLSEGLGGPGEGLGGPGEDLGGPGEDSGGPKGDSRGLREGLGGPKGDSRGPGQDLGGPEKDLGGPRGDSRGPRGDSGGLGQDLRGPREDLGGPGDDSRGPKGDPRGPKGDSGGPGKDSGGPREDLGGPGQDSRGPNGDSRSPRKDSGGPDEDLGGPEGDLGGPQEDSGGPQEDLGALAPAFLLGLCLEHAAKEFPAGHFPELLGKVAGMLRETVWEKIKEIGDRQPESPPDGDPPPFPDLSGVTADLRPLLGWLANSVELLNLAQAHMAQMEAQLDIEGPCPELEKDLESCDEALGVLDEVIMSTFQQSVYYLTKTLYSALPALLDTNPFVGPGEPRAGPDLGGVPEGLRPPLAVFGAVLGLTRDCRLHPDLASQTFGYLFFFSNASLFNTLMEKGSAGPFFQWWVGVRLRTNLDLVLDGLGALGLGDIAGDFFRKLSATANLLCTPRGCLEQATWARLRAEFPALSPAQLHHVLRHYRLGRGRAAPPAWSPTPEESTAATTGDIFESFSDHPPLLLPTRGFRLRPGVPLGPGGLLRPLLKIRRRLWELEGGEDP